MTSWKVPKKKYTFKTKKPHDFPSYTDPDSEPNERMKSLEEYVKFIDKTSLALKSTQFYLDMISLIKQTAISLPISKIIALGLGPFSSSTSVLQFSLLVSLKNEFTVEHVDIYEPRSTTLDEEVANYYNITTVENRNGLYPNSKEEYVLYYMPHCPYRLYNNVIWSNWEQLSNICILGNSFESYKLRKISSSITDPSDCIFAMYDSFIEKIVWRDQHANDNNGVTLLNLELAFCELAFIQSSPDYLIKLVDVIKPSREQIDAATATDVEMIVCSREDFDA